MNIINLKNKQSEIMRILLVYPGFPPEEEIGEGISTFVEDLAFSLADIKCEVLVFSRSKKVFKNRKDF